MASKLIESPAMSIKCFLEYGSTTKEQEVIIENGLFELLIDNLYGAEVRVNQLSKGNIRSYFFGVYYGKEISLKEIVDNFDRFDISAEQLTELSNHHEKKGRFMMVPKKFVPNPNDKIKIQLVGPFSSIYPNEEDFKENLSKIVAEYASCNFMEEVQKPATVKKLEGR